MCVQQTTYIASMGDIVQLPVHGMKGEGKSAIWGLKLQKRSTEKEKERLQVYDAMEVTMAPDELNVVVMIDGYAFKPEPQ